MHVLLSYHSLCLWTSLRGPDHLYLHANRLRVHPHSDDVLEWIDNDDPLFTSDWTTGGFEGLAEWAAVTRHKRMAKSKSRGHHITGDPRRMGQVKCDSGREVLQDGKSDDVLFRSYDLQLAYGTGTGTATATVTATAMTMTTANYSYGSSSSV
jgi:hypothetical protein